MDLWGKARDELKQAAQTWRGLAPKQGEVIDAALRQRVVTGLIFADFRGVQRGPTRTIVSRSEKDSPEPADAI